MDPPSANLPKRLAAGSARSSRAASSRLPRTGTTHPHSAFIPDSCPRPAIHWHETQADRDPPRSEFVQAGRPYLVSDPLSPYRGSVSACYPHLPCAGKGARPSDAHRSHRAEVARLEPRSGTCGYSSIRGSSSSGIPALRRSINASRFHTSARWVAWIMGERNQVSLAFWYSIRSTPRA